MRQKRERCTASSICQAALALAGKTTIRKDKRYNTDTKITDKDGTVIQASYIIMVDADTYVNYDAVENGVWKLGAIGGNVIIGKTITFINLKEGKMTVETKAAGGGTIENKDCSSIKAINPAVDYGETAKGLLGMDQMDTIKADAKKNAAGTAAWMARR